MDRGEILDKTKQIITQDRNNQYGRPENSFGDIANFWNDYLDDRLLEPLEGSDVAAMMVLFKTARLKFAKKEDTWVDICGYASIGAELTEVENG